MSAKTKPCTSFSPVQKQRIEQFMPAITRIIKSLTKRYSYYSSIDSDPDSLMAECYCKAMELIAKGNINLDYPGRILYFKLRLNDHLKAYVRSNFRIPQKKGSLNQVLPKVISLNSPES